MCSELDPLSHFKRLQMGYLVFHRERLEPRLLLWQQDSRYHFVSFVMYISGAKFEEHCSNMSGDMYVSINRFFLAIIILK